MNLFSGLWARLKRFIFPQAAVERVFGVPPVTSREMEENINLWYAMYINQPPWRTDRVKPLGLPAAICREMARPVLAEFQADITGGARADYLAENFQAASEGFLRQLETGLALGGVAFKPYPFEDRLLVDATGAAGFQPTRFDAAGTCIGGVFKDKPVAVDKKYFIRLEYHDLQGTVYTIHNRAFQSDAYGSIGSETSLTAVPEWAGIQPEVAIAGLTAPLFAYFKTPIANNIDYNSPAGVSMYSGAAVDLIRQADEQWQMLQWEYKSGRRKIYMDGVQSNAAQFDMDLFELGHFSSEGNFYKEFSPEFRDEPLYRGLQNILKQIEFQVGLSYGAISDPQTVDKTATEVRNSKQRMYITVDSIQKALQHTFDGLLYAMDVYATLYQLAPAGNYTVMYKWGDSVLDDEETERLKNQDMRADVAAGILRPEWYLARKYGVTEDEARKMMPDMETLADEKQEEVE